jgi:hypothetical protein
MAQKDITGMSLDYPRFFILVMIISASLRLSATLEWTTGEFLISSLFSRIAAMTAAAMSLAFSLRPSALVRLAQSGDGAGDPLNILSGL